MHSFVCLFVCMLVCLFSLTHTFLHHNNICLLSFVQKDKVGSFVCLCDDGYEGTLCDMDYDDCTGNLCEEQGTCVVSL